MKRINRTKFYFYLTLILIFSNSFSYSATFWAQKYFSNLDLLFYLICSINSLLFLIFLPIFLSRLKDAGFSYFYLFIPIVNLIILLLPSRINRIDDKRDIFNCAKPLGRKDFIMLYPLPFLAMILIFFTTYIAFLFFEFTASGKNELFEVFLISNITYLALHALFLIYSAFFIIAVLIKRLKDLNLQSYWAYLIVLKYFLITYILELSIYDNILEGNEGNLLFIFVFFFLPEILLAIVPSKKLRG